MANTIHPAENQKFIERFGDIKISDDLKAQILMYVDRDSLVIANEHIAVLLSERSEYGRGVGYWDQVHVFCCHKRIVKEWNWRHKDYQHLDQKHLAVNGIGAIKATNNNENQVIIQVELLNNSGSRSVNFEFNFGENDSPFRKNEKIIQIKKVNPTEEYARKKMEEKLKYAIDPEDIRKFAEKNGIEPTEADFRQMMRNNLQLGLIEYFQKAQEAEKACGLEMTMDDYMFFVCKNLGRRDTKPIVDIKTVDSFAKFSESDFQKIIDLCIATNGERGMRVAVEMVDYGKLDKSTFHRIASAYIERCPKEAFQLSKEKNFKFSKAEYRRIVKEILSEGASPWKNNLFFLRQAQEVANAGGIKIAKKEYRKFLIDSIFGCSRKPRSPKKYPKEELEQIRKLTEEAGIEITW
ncbi:MAG: hypothetical protein WC848_02125 [Parcubacteria group bacterium]|jgi:hypothetical protein